MSLIPYQNVGFLSQLAKSLKHLYDNEFVIRHLKGGYKQRDQTLKKAKEELDAMLGNEAKTKKTGKSYSKNTTSSKRRYSTTNKSKFIGPMLPKKRTKYNTNKLSARVAELEERVKDDEGVLIYRFMATGKVSTAGISQQYMNGYGLNTTGAIETAIANLRYFNPATPGTFTTVDAGSGSNSKAVRVKNYGWFRVTNNYQVPCDVTVYICAPRTDTAIAPWTAVDNGLADMSALTKESISVSPWDSQQFRDLWMVKEKKSGIIMPGQNIKINWSTQFVVYDPSYVDSVTSQYQPGLEGRVAMIQMKGVIGHDSGDGTQQGYLLASLDVDYQTCHTVHYPAGIKIRYLVENSAAVDTVFTNGGVVSEQPIADNIGYSMP